MLPSDPSIRGLIPRSPAPMGARLPLNLTKSWRFQSSEGSPSAEEERGSPAPFLGTSRRDGMVPKTCAHRIPNQTLKRRAGFTLIELVLVVVILAILAAVVVPVYRDRTQQAQASTMATVVHSVRAQLKVHFAEHGSYPATMDPTWFDRDVVNAFSDTANADQIFVPNHPTHLYPSNKTFSSGSGNSMWYNQGTGSFCVRIPEQGSVAANIELFNQVNQANISALNDRR